MRREWDLRRSHSFLFYGDFTNWFGKVANKIMNFRKKLMHTCPYYGFCAYIFTQANTMLQT